MYAIILTENDVTYCTTHTFEREDIWDWLHQEISFPPGKSDMAIPMPAGYADTAYITIGSTRNDMAQALVGDGCQAAGVQYRIVFADDAEDSNEYTTQATKEVLMLGVPAEHIYAGLYY